MAPIKTLIILFLALAVWTSAGVAQNTVMFQTGHTHDILEVKFSPNDSQLVSYSAGDGRLCLWDVLSGRLLWMTKTGFIRRGNERINLKEFYWSEDGRSLVTKSENDTYQQWDSETGKIQALSDLRPKINLINPNKKLITYTRSYDKISLIDPDTNKTSEISRYGNNSAFDTSNDGTMIAEGGSWGNAAIRITDIDSGESRWLDGHPGVVGGIAFSPDGKFLAVGGSDKTIYIFDPATRTLHSTLTGNSKPINALAFSPDGKYLASSEKFGVMRVWNFPARVLVTEIKPESVLGQTKIVFSPDGKHFAVANDSSGIDLWEVGTWRLVRKFCFEQKDSNYECGSKAISIDFSNDGNRLFAGYENGTIKIWDLKRSKPVQALRNGKDDNHIGVIADGRRFVAGSNEEDRPIKLIDSLTGKELVRYSDGDMDGYIESLAVRPGNKFFVTSDIGGDVYLWNVSRPTPVRRHDIGFSGNDAIAFSPDGRTFAIGGRNQNLFLFDAQTGENLWQLLPSYQPSELERKLNDERIQRQSVFESAKEIREKEAAKETSKYKNLVYVRFAHYGDMRNPGEKRMLESDMPKESNVKKTPEDSNAVWLRLHNDSPLPIAIPTQSIYPANAACFFEFPTGTRINGLCDNREISIWHGLQNKKGTRIPYGFDFGASAVLLPKTSVVFAVPREILRTGNTVVFDYRFKKDAEGNKIENYGPPKSIRFTEADINKKTAQ